MPSITPASPTLSNKTPDSQIKEYRGHIACCTIASKHTATIMLAAAIFSVIFILISIPAAIVLAGIAISGLIAFSTSEIVKQVFETRINKSK